MLPLLPSGVAALRIPHQTNAGTGTVLVGPDRRALPAGTVGGRQWTMPSLLVVTGPPGAGKSTVAGILADRAEPSVLVAGDDFFGFLARGAIPPWLPASNEQNEVVTQAAAAAAGRYAAEGFVTVYDGVVGPWFLPTFVAASGLGRLDYVVLMPPVELCVERVATRRGHGFTDEAATRKMHSEFARSDIDARHVVVDPPERPDAVADHVLAARERGSLAVTPTARVTRRE